MPFKQITLGKTTITKFLTAEKVILKKTKHNRASILKKKEKKRGKKNRNHVPPAPQVEIKVIFKRKLQSLTGCTPPAADPDRGERISLTV